MITLRPYQAEAIDGGSGFPGVLPSLERCRSTLVVAATGTGKTTIFAAVAERFRPLGRVLILAHREELINQAAARIRAQTSLSVGIEMASTRSDRLAPPDVVVGTVQTLCRPKRLETFAPDHFGLIVVDEAHHAIATTYTAILDYFTGAKVLGVTATPDRGDGEAMGKAFESVAYVYEIRDAIEQGYLCPIKQRAIHVDGLDFSKVRTTAGDLNERDLEAVMMQEEHLHAVAKPSLELAGDRPTMVFATTVAHAHALAAVLDRYRPGSARALDGTSETDLRKSTLAEFAGGRFQFLVNCALFTEGFDEPSIACVAVARPTKSRALYCQMVGRGTRLHPGKADLLILDFKGNAGRHSLVSGLDILDGNEDADVKERAAKLIADEPEQTVMEAIEEASRQLAEEQRKRVLASAARYTAQTIDPFSMVQTFLGVTPRAGRWGGAPPRPEDVAFVEKYGKGIRLGHLDGGQVAEIAAAIRKRFKEGRTSFNMARVLIKAGLDPDVSFPAGQIAMAALAAHDWQPTAEIRAAFALVTQQREKTAALEKARDKDTRAVLEDEVAALDALRAAAFRGLRRFSMARAS